MSIILRLKRKLSRLVPSFSPINAYLLQSTDSNIYIYFFFESDSIYFLISSSVKGFSHISRGKWRRFVYAEKADTELIN